MSLKAELEALSAQKPRTFEQWLTTADNEDRELVLSYINSDVPPNALAALLTNNGIPITRETIVKRRDAR